MNNLKGTTELSDSISMCGKSESISYNKGVVLPSIKKDYSYKSYNLCTFKRDLCTMNAHKVYRLNRLRYILLTFFAMSICKPLESTVSWQLMTFVFTCNIKHPFKIQIDPQKINIRIAMNYSIIFKFYSWYKGNIN